MPGYDGYDISHNKDGSITFVCSPKDAGTYRISVERDGQILNGLPICCVVQVTTTGYVTAYKTSENVDEDLVSHAETMQTQLPELTEHLLPDQMSYDNDGQPKERSPEEPASESALGQGTLVPVEILDDLTEVAEEDRVNLLQETSADTRVELIQGTAEDAIQQSMEDGVNQDGTPQENSDDMTVEMVQKAAADTVDMIEDPSDERVNPDQSAEEDQDEYFAAEILPFPDEEPAPLEQPQESSRMDEQTQDGNITEEEGTRTEQPAEEEELEQESSQEEPRSDVEDIGRIIKIEPIEDYIDTPRRQSRRSVVLPAKYRDATFKTETITTRSTRNTPIKTEPGLKEIPKKATPVVAAKSKKVETAKKTRSDARVEEKKSEPSKKSTPQRGRKRKAPEVEEDDVNSQLTIDLKTAASMLLMSSDEEEDGNEFAVEEEIMMEVKIEKVQENKQLEMSGDEEEDITHGTFPCGECGNVFDKLSLLERHMEFHNEKPYICGVISCKRQFKSESGHYEHCEKFHSNVPNSYDLNSVPCAVRMCGKTFANPSLMREHMSKVHWNKVICKVCFRVLGSNAKLIEHMQTHAEDLTFHCDIAGCSQKFKTQYLLTIHKKNHDEPRVKLECPQCGKFLMSQKNLDNHIRSFHSDAGPRKNHKKKLMCDTCGKLMKTKWSLTKHVEEMHVMEEIKVVNENEEVVPYRPYKCGYCGKGFKRESVMKEHIALHESRSMVQCTGPNCKKTFPTIYRMKEHIRAVHKHAGKIHRCRAPGCDAQFKTSTGLACHDQKVHKNIRYRCMDESCGAEFTTRFCMLSHFKLKHEGAEGVNCEVCHKTYPSKLHLRHHMVSHKTVKDEICSVCNKGFKSKSALASHTKIHFLDQQYHCEFCGKPFPRKQRLREHILHVHSTVQEVVELEHKQYVHEDQSGGEEDDNKPQIIHSADGELMILPNEVTYEVQDAVTEIQNSSGKHILIIEQVEVPVGQELDLTEAQLQ